MIRPGKQGVASDAIVVAYRSSDVIRQCVVALRTDPAIGRIVVVNNSARDGTEAALAAIDQVIYIEAPGNIGYGPAVNLARPRIAASYVVLVNPDAVQDSTTTTQLLRFVAERPRCAVIAPRMVTPTGRIERNSQYDFGLVRMLCQAIGWPQKLQMMRTPAEHLTEHRTECVIGAFVLCRVEALDDVGWFDESIFLFGEDQDLCRRLRARGWEIWFAPVGWVEHLDGHSWRQLSDEGTELFRQARYRELSKAAGRVEAETYRGLVRARDAVLKLTRRRRLPHR